MGCLALSYFEQGFPPFAGRSVFLSTAKAAQRSALQIEIAVQRCPQGNEKSCAGSYKFGFNGQEKVNEIAGIGNHTTALFWEYDTRIARRWNLDPVVDPTVSPYDVFKSNPIFYADPLGNVVKGSTKGMAAYDSYKAKINSRINGANEKMQLLNEKLEHKLSKGKSTKNIQKDIDNKQNELEQLKGVLGELQALEKSDQVYYLDLTHNEPALNARGATRFNPKTNNIDVSVYVGDDNIGSTLSHELVHAYQFETGKISFTASGNSGLLYDLMDEVEAHTREQLIYGTFSGVSITTNWLINNRGYSSKLRHDQVTISTSDGGASTYGAQLRSQIWRYGKSGAPVQEVIKGWQINYLKGKAKDPTGL